MKYICTSDFYVDMCNEMCCFIPRKRLHVPKDSIWETSEDNYLDLPDGIHLASQNILAEGLRLLCITKYN